MHNTRTDRFLVGNGGHLYDIYSRAGLTRLPLGTALTGSATQAQIEQRQADQQDFDVSVQTLERLRVLFQESDMANFDERVQSPIGPGRHNLNPEAVIKFIDAAMRYKYYMTLLGYRFVSACRPPDKKS